MPKQCPCEIALLEHIPIRSVVWTILSFYHRDDDSIIAELTDPRHNRHGAFIDHAGRIVHLGKIVGNLTIAESKTRTVTSANLLQGDGYVEPMIAPEQLADRWVFEASLKGTYVRFLGTEYGKPLHAPCSVCVITVVDGKIVVEIDKVRVDIDRRGEFGSYLGTPFMKSRRARLRSMMYNLAYLDPSDPQHRLFDKVCDLAHETIWGWIH